MNVGILGTGSYVPDTIVGNDGLEKRLQLDEGWIFNKTGIKERRYAVEGDATSDLALRASRRALDAADLDPEELDLIVLASGTVDQPSPATACFVQAQLGALNAASFDVMAVCAGFLYGLTVARDMLIADPSRRYALVVGAEVYSRFLDFDDRGTCVLLGDGAGAVVLGRTDQGGILASNLGTDGTLTHLGYIAGGGSRAPASADSLSSGLHFVSMKGREVRELIVNIMPGIVDKLLSSAGLGAADLDLVVPHQANGVMLREWADLLGIDHSQVLQTVAKYGNTGAASVPLTLDDAVQGGRVQPGSRLLFISFGAGISWGAVLVEWVSP